MYNTEVKQALLYGLRDVQDQSCWQCRKPELGSNTNASRGLWVSSDRIWCLKWKDKYSSKEETLKVAWTCDKYVDRTSLSQCTVLNTWPQLFKSWIALSTGRIEIYSVDSVIHLPKNYIADKSETLDNEAPDSRKGENRGGPLGVVGPSNSLCYRQGRLVGGLMCHRMRKGELRWGAFYITILSRNPAVSPELEAICPHLRLKERVVCSVYGNGRKQSKVILFRFLIAPFEMVSYFKNPKFCGWMPCMVRTCV